MISRIAPTPSGFIHIGNAFNFIFTWLLVKSNKGKLILRIDDLDYKRCKSEYLNDLMQSLEWIGITWDEGPFSVSDVKKFSQHTRLDLYKDALNELRTKNNVFACACSRSELQDKLQYPENCLHKTLEFSQHAWRFITPASMVTFYDKFQNAAKHIDLYNTMRHPIIKRRDGLPAYQIASLVDDILMQVDTIVRGIDLENSTATQLQLAEVLGKRNFSKTSFYHHPLLMGDKGLKFSKSAGSYSLKEFRKSHTKQELFKQFAYWLKIDFEGEKIEDLLIPFSKKINHSLNIKFE